MSQNLLHESPAPSDHILFSKKELLVLRSRKFGQECQEDIGKLPLRLLVFFDIAILDVPGNAKNATQKINPAIINCRAEC